MAIRTLVEERTEYADGEIDRLRTFSGDNRQLANRALLLVEKLEKRLDLVLQSHIEELKQEMRNSARTPP